MPTAIESLWEDYCDNGPSVFENIGDRSLTFQDGDGANTAMFVFDEEIDSNTLNTLFRKIDPESLTKFPQEHQIFFSGLINSRISVERLQIAINHGMNPGVIHENQDALEIAVQQCQGGSRNSKKVFDGRSFENQKQKAKLIYDFTTAEMLLRSGKTVDYPGVLGETEADKIKNIRETGVHPNDYRFEDISEEDLAASEIPEEQKAQIRQDYKKVVIEENRQAYTFRVQVAQGGEELDQETKGLIAVQFYLRKFQQRECLYRPIAVPPTTETMERDDLEETVKPSNEPKGSIFDCCFKGTKDSQVAITDR